jgi:hypothetical protein
MTYADQRKEWIKSRRNRRKHARRARVHRQVLRYILLAALVWGGYEGLTHLPWHVGNAQTDVIVRGNSVVTADQVRTALGDITEARIFQIDPRKLEQRVRALSAIKYAFVRRVVVPKPAIIVEVLEEYPWASFSTSPEQPAQAVIAQSGRMIPIKDFPAIEQPKLVVYGNPNLKLNSKSVSQWASWISFINTQTGQPVEFVDLRRSFDVCVQDGDLYLRLGAADATLTRRIGRLSSILTAIEPLKSRLEFINLALDNNIPLKVAKKPIENKPGTTDGVNRMQQAQLSGHATM